MESQDEDNRLQYHRQLILSSFQAAVHQEYKSRQRETREESKDYSKSVVQEQQMQQNQNEIGSHAKEHNNNVD